MIRVGINGLGRIGRCIVRAIYESKKYQDQGIDLAAINGSRDPEMHAHLLQYDSVHGQFKFKIGVSENKNALIIDNEVVPLYKERKPEDMPWGKHNVDVILECSGAFNKKEEAKRHLHSGVKKVIVSAPVSGADVTLVYGVNNYMLQQSHDVISAASCTTNCLAPMLNIMHGSLGVKNAFMTTIHSYTNDQNVVDGSHKDLRRARACALSMIPTTTGAAKNIGLVIPELQDRIDGTAIRVPTPNVSMTDLTFTAIKSTTVDEINQIIKDAAKDSSIVMACDLPLVSIDFIHNPYSAIIDLNSTHVVDNNLCRIAAWYDNEWAFSLRMLDIISLLKPFL